MKQTLTLLFFLSYLGLAFCQVDTIGQFTFKEKIRDNYYETTQNIWQNEHGDFYMKLSERKMNIYASFRIQRKSEWLHMIERFEEMNKKKSPSLTVKQEPLNFPIKTEIVRFKFLGDEEYSVLRPTLNFTFVSGQNNQNKSVTMLVIEVPKLADAFDERYSLEGFNLYLTPENVSKLKGTLQKIKQ